MNSFFLNYEQSTQSTMDRLSNPCKQVSELLALETNFRIICPEWLRERLLDRLKRVFSANSGDEKTV